MLFGGSAHSWIYIPDTTPRTTIHQTKTPEPDYLRRTGSPHLSLCLQQTTNIGLPCCVPAVQALLAVARRVIKLSDVLQRLFLRIAILVSSR